MQRRALISGLAALSVVSLRSTGVQAQSPDEERNRAVVRRFFVELRNARNPGVAGELLSPDYTVPGDQTAAPGIEAFVARMGQYFDQLARDFTRFEWIEDALIAVGDVVVWRGRERGETTTGRRVNVANVSWFELDAAGLIVHIWGGYSQRALTATPT